MDKGRRAGFTLLECLLYLAITVFCLVLMAHFCASFLSRIKQLDRSLDNKVELLIAVAAVARDVRDWPELGPVRASWELKAGRLMRRAQGAVVVVARGIDRFELHVDYKERRRAGATIILQTKHTEVGQYVAISPLRRIVHGG